MGASKRLYEEMQEEFLAQVEQVEMGELAPIDLAVKFHEERQMLAELDAMRKDWQAENLDSILQESDNYGKEGYKGYKFSSTSRPMYKYDNNPKWVEIEDQRKEIESQMKAAYLNAGKNLVNVTFDGEEVILPKVTYTTPSLKTERLKK